MYSSELLHHPRLEVDGAIYDEDGFLCLSAYHDLKSVFSDIENWPDPDKPGVFQEDSTVVHGLRVWNDEEGRRRKPSRQDRYISKGWIAQRHDISKHRNTQRWFSVQTWGSWRLAFLLAKLQRTLWERCASQSSSKQVQVADENPREKFGRWYSSSDFPLLLDSACLLEEKISATASDEKMIQNEASEESAPKLRRRVMRKEHPQGLGDAAATVFGQFEPFFNRLLDTNELGANPSPFDLQALAATCSAFRHLREPSLALPRNFHTSSRRKRLHGKQQATWLVRSRICKKQSQCEVVASWKVKKRKRLVSPLEYAFMVFARQRGAVALSVAVSVGDLDAVRYRILRRSDPTEALALAVCWMKLPVIKYLLKVGASPNGRRGIEAPLHIALQLWHKNYPPATQILQTLLQYKPDLNQPIWPVAALRPQGLKQAECPQSKPTVGYHLPSSLANLPFLRCGDPPLAWLLNFHAEACGTGRECSSKSAERNLSQRIVELARILVAHGACPDKLSRRQALSFQQLMQQTK